MLAKGIGAGEQSSFGRAGAFLPIHQGGLAPCHTIGQGASQAVPPPQAGVGGQGVALTIGHDQLARTHRIGQSKITHAALQPGIGIAGRTAAHREAAQVEGTQGGEIAQRAAAIGLGTVLATVIQKHVTLVADGDGHMHKLSKVVLWIEGRVGSHRLVEARGATGFQGELAAAQQQREAGGTIGRGRMEQHRVLAIGDGCGLAEVEPALEAEPSAGDHRRQRQGAHVIGPKLQGERIPISSPKRPLIEVWQGGLVDRFREGEGDLVAGGTDSRHRRPTTIHRALQHVGDIVDATDLGHGAEAVGAAFQPYLLRWGGCPMQTPIAGNLIRQRCTPDWGHHLQAEHLVLGVAGVQVLELQGAGLGGAVAHAARGAAEHRGGVAIRQVGGIAA